VSRDALLYVADVVAAGEAILRYIDGVTYDAFARPRTRSQEFYSDHDARRMRFAAFSKS